MLISSVFEIKPKDEVTIPATNGNFVHAMLLNLIREIDPELSGMLHKNVKNKPFTVSPIMGPAVASDKGSHITLIKDKKYWFRITGLNDEVSSCLMRLNPDRVVIADEEFEVLGVFREDHESKEARTTTFESLYNEWMGKRPADYIKLKFYSPTTFRVGRKNEPLPLPRLIFCGLIDKWNKYSPVPFDKGLIDLVDEGVILSEYNLSTRMYEFGRYRQVGFIGECRFKIKIKEPIWVKILHLLADFSFFAGVGYKTTMGMGQTKKIV